MALQTPQWIQSNMCSLLYTCTHKNTHIHTKRKDHSKYYPLYLRKKLWIINPFFFINRHTFQLQLHIIYKNLGKRKDIILEKVWALLYKSLLKCGLNLLLRKIPQGHQTSFKILKMSSFNQMSIISFGKQRAEKYNKNFQNRNFPLLFKTPRININ